MELLLIIAGAAAVVWILWLVLRGSLMSGLLGLLIAGAIFGHAFWSEDLGPVPLTVERILAALIAAMYLVHRWIGRADPKPLGAAEWLLLALVGVLLVSTFTNDWRYHHSQPVFKLIQYVMIPAVVYWIVRQSPFDRQSTLWCLGALGVFGVWVAVVGLLELTGHWWALWPRHLASPDLEFFGRARGPLLNPAANGILISLCLAAALMFWPRLGRRGKLALIVLVGLAAGAIYGTLTRTAWMGSLLSLALIVGLCATYQWRVVLATGCALAGAALLSMQWDGIWNLKRDVHLDASAAAESVELRPILARVAWNMFLDRPLVGCGFGQYEREKLGYLSDRSSTLPLEKSRPYVQHNAFLALLTETGILGAGVFVALLSVWALSAWRLWADVAAALWMRQVGLVYLALLAAYLPTANFHDTNAMEMVNTFVFFVGGLVSGVSATRKREAAARAAIRLADLPQDDVTQRLAVAN